LRSGVSSLDKVISNAKVALLHQHWRPRIGGKFSGQLMKFVKFQGEFG
jgi:hypothetical protein